LEEIYTNFGGTYIKLKYQLLFDNRLNQLISQITFAHSADTSGYECESPHAFYIIMIDFQYTAQPLLGLYGTIYSDYMLSGSVLSWQWFDGIESCKTD
jgi:hypothetical protein